MAKRKPKEKCEHGNSRLRMSGCAVCVLAAMEGYQLCRSFGCTPREMIIVLHKHYRTVGELRRAVELAKMKYAVAQKTKEIRRGKA